MDSENWGVISSYVCGSKHFLNHGPLWESNEHNKLHSQKNAHKQTHEAWHVINYIALENVSPFLRELQNSYTFLIWFFKQKLMTTAGKNYYK